MTSPCSKEKQWHFRPCSTVHDDFMNNDLVRRICVFSSLIPTLYSLSSRWWRHHALTRTNGFPMLHSRPWWLYDWWLGCGCYGLPYFCLFAWFDSIGQICHPAQAPIESVVFGNIDHVLSTAVNTGKADRVSFAFWLEKQAHLQDRVLHVTVDSFLMETGKVRARRKARVRLPKFYAWNIN